MADVVVVLVVMIVVVSARRAKLVWRLLTASLPMMRPWQKMILFVVICSDSSVSIIVEHATTAMTMNCRSVIIINSWWYRWWTELDWFIIIIELTQSQRKRAICLISILIGAILRLLLGVPITIDLRCIIGGRRPVGMIWCSTSSQHNNGRSTSKSYVRTYSYKTINMKTKERQIRSSWRLSFITWNEILLCRCVEYIRTDAEYDIH